MASREVGQTPTPLTTDELTANPKASPRFLGQRATLKLISGAQLSLLMDAGYCQGLDRIREAVAAAHDRGIIYDPGAVNRYYEFAGVGSAG
jgi:hypothetical protein